jgi:hypothetical protein
MAHSLALFVRSARRQGTRWQSRLYQEAIAVEREMRSAQRRFRVSVPAFLRTSSLRNLVTAPLVYSLALPLVLADVWLTTYQWICFPLYRIARVPRRGYFVIDRHKLAYLNPIEKLHCTYCSYATGLIAYIREIAARTEQYWCPIKHGRRVRAPHGLYPTFVDYGDGAGYRARGSELRAALRSIRPSGWIAVSAGPRARSLRRRAG